MESKPFSPILTTSGFVLPDNKYFNRIESIDIFNNLYLGGGDASSLQSSLHPTLSKIIDKGLVSTSPKASDAYLEYIACPSFDGFMLLVDIVTELFKDLSYLDFVKLQVTNGFLSPMGFKMLLDLPGTDRTNDLVSYTLLPSFLIGLHNCNHKEMNTREARVKNMELRFGCSSLEAVEVICSLIEDKPSFLAFFKLILTSSLR